MGLPPGGKADVLWANPPLFFTIPFFVSTNTNNPSTSLRSSIGRNISALGVIQALAHRINWHRLPEGPKIVVSLKGTPAAFARTSGKT